MDAEFGFIDILPAARQYDLFAVKAGRVLKRSRIADTRMQNVEVVSLLRPFSEEEQGIIAGLQFQDSTKYYYSLNRPLQPARDWEWVLWATYRREAESSEKSLAAETLEHAIRNGTEPGMRFSRKTHLSGKLTMTHAYLIRDRLFNPEKMSSMHVYSRELFEAYWPLYAEFAAKGI